MNDKNAKHSRAINGIKHRKQITMNSPQKGQWTEPFE